MTEPAHNTPAAGRPEERLIADTVGMDDDPNENIRTCYFCWGTGWNDDDDAPCLTCGGDGYVEKDAEQSDGGDHA